VLKFITMTMRYEVESKCKKRLLKNSILTKTMIYNFIHLQTSFLHQALLHESWVESSLILNRLLFFFSIFLFFFYFPLLLLLFTMFSSFFFYFPLLLLLLKKEEYVNNAKQCWTTRKWCRTMREQYVNGIGNSDKEKKSMHNCIITQTFALIPNDMIPNRTNNGNRNLGLRNGIK